MAESQNGWPTLTLDRTRRWGIPGTDPVRALVLHPGDAGLVLAHFALWFHEDIERLDLGPWDEWGWADRKISGSNVISNHVSGTACDLNALRHPQGVSTGATFTERQQRWIRRRLRRNYAGCIHWGGNFSSRPDAMHFEIHAGPRRVRALAAVLRLTSRGRQIMRERGEIGG